MKRVKYSCRSQARICAKFFILLATLMLAACDPPANSQQVASQPVARLAEPWAPYPFDGEAQIVSYNYLASFFSGFQMNARALEKGEFETAADHAARVSSREAYGPFSPDVIYALLIAHDGAFTFDADRSVFKPNLGVPNCGMTRFYTLEKTQLACKVGSVVDRQNKYVGENAFGVRIEVEEAVGRAFNLAISRDSKVLARTKFDDGYISGECQIDRDAEQMKYKLGFAYLIKLLSPEMKHGPMDLEIATISSPVDRQMDRQALQVTIVGYVCFDTTNNRLISANMF